MRGSNKIIQKKLSQKGELLMERKVKMSKIVTSLVLATALLAGTVGLFVNDQMAINAETTEIENIRGIVGQYKLDDSAMEVEVYQINLSTAELVDNSIANMEESNLESGATSTVNARDWSQYTSDTSRNQMSSTEQTYYDRLTALCDYYMNRSTIDAYYVSAYDMYAINGVAFDDLGLTSKEAFLTAEWFLYNNPQYYFLRPKFLTTSSAVYLGCYDIFADGDDRAAITNLMFSTLDSWVTSVNDVEVTNYDKILSAHDLVCGRLSYISNDYDQSVYSAIILNETVCAGYAELMSMLLNASDVDSVTAISDCHAWNIVLFDDMNYYCVDCTWDDSIHGHLFMGCGTGTLRKYDTASDEHDTGYWVKFIPSVSTTDYVQSNSASDINLDEPVITFEKIDDASVRIKWSSVNSADKYELEVYDNSTNVLLGRKTSSYNSLKLTGMTEGQSLYVRCRAVKAVNSVTYYSDWADARYEGTTESSNNDAPVEVVVNKPSGFNTSSVDKSSATLAWNADSNVDSYDLELYSDSGYTQRVDALSTVSNSIVLDNLDDNTPYYARLRAVKSVNGQIYTSDWVLTSFTTAKEEVAVSVSVPANLSAGDITSTSGRVTWSAVSGAYRYNVEVSDSSSFDTILVSGNVSSNRVSLTSLVSGKTYYVRLRTVQSIDGKYHYSDWTSTSFTTTKNISVGKPTGLSASKISPTATRLSWSAVTDATSYEIRVYSDSARTNALISGNVKSTTVRLSGLTPGRKYYISLRTVQNEGGTNYYSAWTNVALQK